MRGAIAALEPEEARPSAARTRCVVLLGPQRKNPILADLLAARGIKGRIATITAGRQEAEGELDELGAAAERAVDLRLHARADAIFTADSSLASVHRARQDILRSLRRLYDLRLAHAVAAIVELEHRGGPPEALEWERHEALDALRELDARHLARVREVFAEWEPRLDLDNRPALVHHREEVADVVAASEAILVAGGHVAILVNRLRLFDVMSMLRPEQLVVGWAAGSMALTERIVVYHDSPPWGLGNAEVFDSGLGLARDVVALPDARHRLRLDDRPRVARFARRFAPAMCVALEEGDSLSLTRDGYEASPATVFLGEDGDVHEVAS
jgi:hypothetical protein